MIRPPIATLATAVLLLSGCSGFKSSEPAVQTYQLRPALPPAQATGPAPAGTSLTVLQPVAAPGLEGERIALVQSGQRFDWYRDAHWNGELTLTVQRALLDALRAGGRFANVASEDAPFTSTYLLEVEIRHFEADYTGGGLPVVRVEIAATLGRRIDRAVLQTASATAEVHADADRMQSVTAAFQSALAQVLGELTSALLPPAT